MFFINSLAVLCFMLYFLLFHLVKVQKTGSPFWGCDSKLISAGILIVLNGNLSVSEKY
jgi:hypothetical protein